MDADNQFPFAPDRDVQSNRPVMYCDKIHGSILSGSLAGLGSAGGRPAAQFTDNKDALAAAGPASLP